ncbi:MAG: hypothetical protein CMH57_02600 [Myxococcales bacterium]|nr:hypothetical protein [Myxococcales bacterium]
MNLKAELINADRTARAARAKADRLYRVALESGHPGDCPGLYEAADVAAREADYLEEEVTHLRRLAQ